MIFHTSLIQFNNIPFKYPSFEVRIDFTLCSITPAKLRNKRETNFQIFLNSFHICLIPYNFELKTFKIRTTFTDYADSKLYKSNFIRIEQYETETGP